MDGEFVGVAEVDRVGDRGVHQFDEAADQVGDVAEGTGLGAGFDYRQGLVVEEGVEEGGDDAAVVEAHSGAVGVEDAGGAGGDAVGGEAEEGFGGPLAFDIAGAGAAAVHIAPVVLALGVFEGVAVDFGGGSEEEAGVLAFSQFDHYAGAEYGGEEGVHRVAVVFEGRGGTSQVVNLLEAAEGGQVGGGGLG